MIQTSNGLSCRQEIFCPVLKVVYVDVDENIPTLEKINCNLNQLKQDCKRFALHRTGTFGHSSPPSQSGFLF